MGQAIRHEEDEITATHIISQTDDLKLINRYTLYFDVKFDHTSQNADLMALFTTLRLTDDGTFKSDGGAGILVNTQGEMGVPNFMGAFSQVPRMTWCLLSVAVDCVGGIIICYCNENKVWEISNQPGLVPGGAFAIDPNAGIGIFGAKDTGNMCGGCIKSVNFSPSVADYNDVMVQHNTWVARSSWQCPQCTVINSLNVTTCTVCMYQNRAR